MNEKRKMYKMASWSLRHLTSRVKDDRSFKSLKFINPTKARAFAHVSVSYVAIVNPTNCWCFLLRVDGGDDALEVWSGDCSTIQRNLQPEESQNCKGFYVAQLLSNQILPSWLNVNTEDQFIPFLLPAIKKLSFQNAKLHVQTEPWRWLTKRWDSCLDAVSWERRWSFGRWRWDHIS